MAPDLVKVNLQLIQSSFPCRHQPLLVTFTDHGNESVIKADIRYFQTGQLTHTKPATVKKFKDGLVPLTFRAAQINRCEKPIYLFNIQGIGKSPAGPGCFQQFGRVDPDDVFQEQIFEESF